ncbi:hypothetical protein TNCV_1092051 [Trichonephila clavipes]|nr:hypothetical protein TNCV_1092051 [Trichonephila clavipes]
MMTAAWVGTWGRESKSGTHSKPVGKGSRLRRVHCPVSRALNRRLISGVWTVNSPQSHIVRVYDAGHGKSGIFNSAEWHDGDWSSDGIREAWLWFFIWVESF